LNDTADFGWHDEVSSAFEAVSEGHPSLSETRRDILLAREQNDRALQLHSLGNVHSPLRPPVDSPIGTNSLLEPPPAHQDENCEIIYVPLDESGEEGSQELAFRCSNCGSVFLSDSIYCRHCGQKRPLVQEEDLTLDSATRELEQLVEETHLSLVRDGLLQPGFGAAPATSVPGLTPSPPAAPSLEAVDRALEELQDSILEHLQQGGPR